MRNDVTYMSVGQCKKDVTPLLMHWSDIFHTLSRRYIKHHFSLVKTFSVLRKSGEANVMKTEGLSWCVSWMEEVQTDTPLAPSQYKDRISGCKNSHYQDKRVVRLAGLNLSTETVPLWSWFCYDAKCFCCVQPSWWIFIFLDSHVPL